MTENNIRDDFFFLRFYCLFSVFFFNGDVVDFALFDGATDLTDDPRVSMDYCIIDTNGSKRENEFLLTKVVLGWKIK